MEKIDFNKIKAVIFDFDGTLYNKKGLAVKLIFADLPHIFLLKAERDVRKSFKGRDFNSGDEFYQAFFTEASKISHTSYEKYENWYRNKYHHTSCKVMEKYYKAYPRVTEVFEVLKSNNIKFAIYSDYYFAKEKSKALNIYSEDLDFYSAEEFGCLKPAKRGFLSIAEKLEVKPENILVVGDRLDTDGEGAQNSGMNFFHIAEPESWTEFATSILENYKD